MLVKVVTCMVDHRCIVPFDLQVTQDACVSNDLLLLPAQQAMGFNGTAIDFSVGIANSCKHAIPRLLPHSTIEVTFRLCHHHKWRCNDMVWSSMRVSSEASALAASKSPEEGEYKKEIPKPGDPQTVNRRTACMPV